MKVYLLIQNQTGWPPVINVYKEDPSSILKKGYPDYKIGEHGFPYFRNDEGAAWIEVKDLN